MLAAAAINRPTQLAAPGCSRVKAINSTAELRAPEISDKTTFGERPDTRPISP